MKYLFFDTEIATSKASKKICEFGYVITDEAFNILERNNYIINPNIKRCDWDWYVAKNILSREVREYEACFDFNHYYIQIDNLINSVDYVFGHSVNGDVEAINDECKRYNLPSINFKFYDVKEMFKEYSGIKRDVSVLDILKTLEIESETGEHDAEVDSVNTMYCLSGMLSELAISLDELIELCPKSIDSNDDFSIHSLTVGKFNKIIDIVLNNQENLMYSYSKERKIFDTFLKRLKKMEKKNDSLGGIKFSVSLNYEERHFKQMFNIVSILHENGAKYVTKATECDYFVEYPMYNQYGEEKVCKKSKHVINAIEEGANIKIISFNELMDIIGITEEQLDEMPMISLECFKQRKQKSFVFSTNIGELYDDLLFQFIS